MTYSNTNTANYGDTGAEELFIDLFQESMGIEAVGSLARQHPFRDIHGSSRFIDYALIGRTAKYAFEIDGEYWHHPESEAVTADKYRDGLLRQNSIIYSGWKLYRWTDAQLVSERDAVIDQLRLFLQTDLSGSSFDGYLPEQDASEFSLRAHQEEALDYLAQARLKGDSIVLLTHATGLGKTITAIFDAKRVAVRTLFLVHRSGLVDQAMSSFREHWPDVSCAKFSARDEKPTAKVVVGTFQGVGANLHKFDRDEFGYIIVDEAHHVAARSFSQTLGYFRPRFTLGMTATPDRHDDKSLVDIFKQCAPRVGLKDAIERGLLSPIRCVRVKTNIDLSHVKYNGHDYRFSDLEQSLQVPERDDIIVQTYGEHVRGKLGVTFCVNVAHSERIAEKYRAAGVSAAAVSGKMNTCERDAVLNAYKSGGIEMLCACDLLNEGWDSPATEVLLMARPTLSRVLYIQQLGRGTRKYPGKKCLYVFDFIDNTSRYAQSVNVHRLFGSSQYRSAALVAATEGDLNEERLQIELGQLGPAFLGLYVERMEEVDVFEWRQAVTGMLTVQELEADIGVGLGTAADWIRAGTITPDLSVALGNRTYHYFNKDSVEIVGIKMLGPAWKRPTTATRRADFLKFVSEMDMAASYKPVLLLSMMGCVSADGECQVLDLASSFRQFYIDRQAAGLPVEHGRNRMINAVSISIEDAATVLLAMPFQRFLHKKFVRRDRDAALVGFDKALWKSLTDEDKANVVSLSKRAIDQYYSRNVE